MAFRMRPTLGSPSTYRLRGPAPPRRSSTSPPPRGRRPGPSFPISFGLNLCPEISFLQNEPVPQPPDSPPPPLEVCVKAALSDPNVLGACPFCQRVLMTLEEKGVAYKLQLVKVESKFRDNDGFGQVGNLPMVKFDGGWVSNPDLIVGMIEGKYPNPSLIAPPVFANVGANVYSAGVKYLKRRKPADGQEQAFVNELKALDEHLQTHGPYIAGQKITQIDLNLAPKLYQLVGVLDLLSWTIPENMIHLHKYMKLVFSRGSFMKTKPDEEHVKKEWETALLMAAGCTIL